MRLRQDDTKLPHKIHLLKVCSINLYYRYTHIHFCIARTLLLPKLVKKHAPRSLRYLC